MVRSGFAVGPGNYPITGLNGQKKIGLKIKTGRKAEMQSGRT